jgi:hypothetical protein
VTQGPDKDIRHFISRRMKNLATYPMHAGPMRMKAVPPNAEAARKTINEVRSGANAVARLSKKKIVEEDRAAYESVSVFLLLWTLRQVLGNELTSWFQPKHHKHLHSAFHKPGSWAPRIKVITPLQSYTLHY